MVSLIELHANTDLPDPYLSMATIHSIKWESGTC